MKRLALFLLLALSIQIGSIHQSARAASPQLPDTTPPPEASQFDFLVGDWTFTAHTKNPRLPPRYSGRWTARRALGGFGITDEWRILTPDGKTAYLGFTARVYDRKTKSWKLQFLNVFAGRWSTQHALFRDGEMHLWWDDEEPDGRPFTVRVRYFDIRPDGFRWEMNRSYDGGATWIDDYLTMETHRAPAQ